MNKENELIHLRIKEVQLKEQRKIANYQHLMYQNIIMDYDKQLHKIQKRTKDLTHEYKIRGEQCIEKYDKEWYMLDYIPTTFTVTWNLDEDSIKDGVAEIVNSDGNCCEIMMLQEGKPVKLEAKDEKGELLDYFIVYGIKEKDN